MSFIRLDVCHDCLGSVSPYLLPTPSETGEFVEYLLAIDYQKYYETIPNQAPTGAQNVEFSAFSLKSLKATIGKLDQFLALVPPQALEDARSQMEIVNSGF